MLAKPKFQEVKALAKKSWLYWLATGLVFGLLVWLSQTVWSGYLSRYAFINGGGLLLLSGMAGGLVTFLALRRVGDADNFSILSVAAGLLLGALSTFVFTMAATFLWYFVGLFFLS